MKNKAKADNSCTSMAVFGSACDPLHRGHEEMVNITLRHYVDRVVIWPSGASRPDKPAANASNLDRIAMCKLVFERNPRVSFVFNDLLLERFTRTHEIDKQIKETYGVERVYHMIGSDWLVKKTNGDGGVPLNNIQRYWQDGHRLFQELNFIVFHRSELPISRDDYPPNAITHLTPIFGVSSTLIRNCVKEGKSIAQYVNPQIAEYIKEKKLYR